VKTIGNLIVRHRLATAVILIAAFVFCGWRASKLKEDLSFETLYLSGDPEIEFSDAFAAEFENINDMIAVAVTGENIFSPLFLKSLSEITYKLEKLPYVASVKSLANIRYIKGKGEDLDVVEFLEDLPETKAEEQTLRRRAMAYELFRGRMLSKDGKYTAVIVQTEDIVGRSAAPEIERLLAEIRDGNREEREFAARQLLLRPKRLKKALNLPESETEQIIAKLASDDEAERESAADHLARSGPGLVRTMTVEDRRTLIGEIERTVQKGLSQGYTCFITGTNVVERDYSRILNRDRIVFNILAVIAIGVMFYVSFRSVRDMLLALTSLALAAVCSLGVIQLCGGMIDIIGSVIITMILVVGTSDAVYMITGFYRSRVPGNDQDSSRKAVADMVATQGFACLMTSLTTAGGFFSLYFARIGTISRFGLYMALSIMVTYSVSLVSLTLFLSFIRTVPEWRSRTMKQGMMNGLLSRIAAAVTAHPVRVLVIFGVFLAVSAWGITELRVESRAVSELSEESPTKRNIRAMENLAGFIGFEVSIKAKDGRKLIEPDIMNRIDSITAYLEDQPETIETWSFVDYLKLMNRSAQGGRAEQYTVPDSPEAAEQFILFYSFSPEGRREINSLLSADRTWARIVSRVYDVGAEPYLALKDRVENLGANVFPSGNMKVNVTSESYLLHSAMDRMVSDLGRSICWAFVFVSLLMMVTLKSVRMGVITVIPNLLPAAAALGFMGVAGIPLRVGTVVVFSLGLGIAVDDTIHYMLRYKINRNAGSDHTEAVFATHSQVGRPLIQTSLVLMAGFGVMGFASFKSISHMGILNSFTIGAALLGDLFITPLLLKAVNLRKRTSAPGVDEKDAAFVRPSYADERIR